MPYVYLIQPVELVGTNRYKIGMSSLRNLSRLKSYKCGTRYICIYETNKAREVEKQLIAKFNSLYKKIAGNEYFQSDDERHMIHTFTTIVLQNTIPPPIKEEEEYSDPEDVGPSYPEYAMNIVKGLLSLGSTSPANDVPLASSWMQRFGFK